MAHCYQTAAKTCLYLFALMSVSCAAPVGCQGNGNEVTISPRDALVQMRNGFGVLTKVHGRKVLSTILGDEQARGNFVNSSTLPRAVGIMCSLKNAKDKLWTLESRTGQQSEEDVRLLISITDSLVKDSCLWTKSIYQTLYSESYVRLQCSWDEISRMCNHFNSLIKAEKGIKNIDSYDETVRGETNTTSWIDANLSPDGNTPPRVRRLINYYVM